MSVFFTAPGTVYTVPGFLRIIPESLYNFNGFQFFSSNVTGQTGPTFQNFTNPPAPYSNNTDFVTFGYYSNVVNQTFYSMYWYLDKPGYQRWIVPQTGAYSVILCGAPGGTWLGSTTSTAGRSGGMGAVLAGSFDFSRGQNLIIQIGQTGSMWANTNPTQYTQPGRGGGGYSSIVDADNTSLPIALAGGGGGVGWITAGRNGKRSFYLVTNELTNPSTRGSDTVGGSNVAGAGWSQSSFSTISANTWATDCNGGSNGILFDFGGFGGGGPGGLNGTTSVKGGGGGGWIGGSASVTVNDGGSGGFSFCKVSNVAVSPIWGNYTDRFQQINPVADQKSVLGGMCYIRYIKPLYNNFTIRFTNCGNTGPTPPAWSTILNTYSADSNIFNYLVPFPFGFRNGYTAWSVPNSGIYEITAAGAAGGNCTSLSGTFYGGSGQIVTSNVWLKIGDLIIVTVGQKGDDFVSGSGGGGGGGGMTTVHRNGCIFGPTANNAATMRPFPIICAAGGGGASNIANGGDGIYTILTGTNQTSGFSSGSGIYAGSTSRSGTWDCQMDPNQSDMIGCNNFGAGLRGANRIPGTANGGGWGGGGGGNFGGGGGFKGGAGGSDTIPASAGNSYAYYTVTGSGLNSNAHGYVTIKQL